MKTFLVAACVAFLFGFSVRAAYFCGVYDGRRMVGESDAYLRGVVDTQAKWRRMAVRSGAAYWVRNPLTEDGRPNLIQWVPRQEQHVDRDELLAGVH